MRKRKPNLRKLLPARYENCAKSRAVPERVWNDQVSIATGRYLTNQTGEQPECACENQLNGSDRLAHCRQWLESKES